MRFVVCLVLMGSVTHANIYSEFKLKAAQRPVAISKSVDGVEFSGVSRATLLGLLATYEEGVRARIGPRRLAPRLDAQFANNPLTRPFIYPSASVMSFLEHKDPDPGFCTGSGWIQVQYSLRVNLTEVGVGLVFGFAAVTLPQLGEDGGDMSVTLDDKSWIASVIYLVAPISCTISGYLMDKLGRRYSIIISKVPLIVGWLWTGLASNGLHMILGRMMSGLGMGMALPTPRVYIAEISLPNMRGVLGSFNPLAVAIGITLQATAGSYLNWRVLCYIGSGYMFCVFLSDLFLPETPYYLLQNQTTADMVRRTLRKFRGRDYDDREELQDMLEYKVDNNIKKLSTCETVRAVLSVTACKPFLLVMTYIFVAQMSGVTIIVQWTVEILTEAKSSVDSNLGNVIMSATRFATGVLMAIMVYRVSRRALALMSSLGVGVVCFTIFMLLLNLKAPTVFPQIAFTLYMVFATLGYYSQPVMLRAEIYPLQVRGVLTGMSLALACLLAFGTTKFYPNLRSLVGLMYTMLIFSIASILGTVFIFLYLPETRNLTLPDIEEFYNGSRPTLVSQREVRSLQLLGSPQKHIGVKKSGSDKSRQSGDETTGASSSP